MAFSGSGSGTSGDPYQVTSWAQLNEVRDDLTAYYILMNNLGSADTGYNTYASSSANSGEGWIPLAQWTGGDETTFTGTFDGQGYVISDLYCNFSSSSSYWAASLFGVINTGCVIKNLRLFNVEIIVEDDFAAALAGYVAGGTLIDNCHASGSVTGVEYIGGLLSSFFGVIDTISNCSADVDVVGAGQGIGGFASVLYLGTTTNCYATGSVTGTTITGTQEVGGFAGYSGSTTTNCYASGNVTASGERVGGFAGILSDSSHSDCYATGSVTSSGTRVGGFAGISSDDVNNCYATGSVSGDDTFGNVGGFAGVNSSGTISNSFWDTETSGQATSAGGTGKTTAEMKDINTFTDPVTDPTTQSNNTDNVTDINGGTSGSSQLSQQKGQSFVAAANSISKIRLRIFKWNTPTDNIIVTLTSSLGGSSLGSKSIDATTFSSGLVDFEFSSPISVTASSTYYIQVSRSGSRDTTNRCAVYFDFGGNPYASGTMWKRDNNSWSQDDTNNDFEFYVTYSDGTEGLSEAWDISEKSGFSSEVWFIHDGINYPKLSFELLASLTKNQSTDSILRKTYQLTQFTDALCVPENVLIHTTDSSIAQIFNSFLLKEDGDYLLKEDSGKIALEEQLVEIYHSTDSFLASGAAEIELSHTTNSLLRNSETLEHSINSNLKESFNTSHSTDTLLRLFEQLSHNADSLSRSENTLSHSTDALARATATLTHTVDSLLREVFVTTQSTDTYLAASYSLTQSTDALLRATLELSHSTDAFLVGTNQQTHSTDSILRSSETIGHTSDAGVRSGKLISYSTDALLRSRQELAHQTDSLLRSTSIISQTADSLLRSAETLNHTANSYLRKQQVKQHSADSLLRSSQSAQHTTNSMIRTSSELSQSIDALLRASSTISHTADSSITNIISKHHFTDALVHKGFVSIKASAVTDRLFARNQQNKNTASAVVSGARSLISQSGLKASAVTDRLFARNQQNKNTASAVVSGARSLISQSGLKAGAVVSRIKSSIQTN